MAAKYYAITNCGNTNIIFNQFIFNTPDGIKHTADLSTVGGPSNFTANNFVSAEAELLPRQSKIFSIDYEYLSGPSGVKYGNIIVSSLSGQVASVDTIIEVNNIPEPTPAPVPAPVPQPVPAPTPPPVYSLSYTIPGYNSSYINTPQKITINSFYRQYLGRNAEPDGLKFWDDNLNSGNVNLSQIETNIRTSPEAGAWDGKTWAIEQGDQVEVKLTTQNVSIGTQVPYTITGNVVVGDFSNTPLTGRFTVGANGESTVIVTTRADLTMELPETAKITLDNIVPEVSTSFKILDTSQPTRPVPAILGYNPTSGSYTAPGSYVRFIIETQGYANGTVIYAWVGSSPNFIGQQVKTGVVQNEPNTWKSQITFYWGISPSMPIDAVIGLGATDNQADADARRSKLSNIGFFQVISVNSWNSWAGFNPPSYTSLAPGLI